MAGSILARFRFGFCFSALCQEPCAVRHNFAALPQQHLLRRDAAVLVDVRPVDVNPVAVAAAHKPMPVRLREEKIHHGFHFGIHLADISFVTVHHVLVLNTDQPQHCVIHDRVDVLPDLRVSPQCPCCALVDLSVKKQIWVDHHALVSVAGPDPAVALDPVDEEQPAAEPVSLLGHLPDSVQHLIVTIK